MNVQSRAFKFYLHDSIEACRLQLLGPLSARELNELTGCWRTARTTLGRRKLVLDVSAVTSFDDDARKWIAMMVAEGASLVEAKEAPPTRRNQSGAFRKLLSALFGVRAQESL